jgi:hypothetical protein
MQMLLLPNCPIGKKKKMLRIKAKPKEGESCDWKISETEKQQKETKEADKKNSGNGLLD